MEKDNKIVIIKEVTEGFSVGNKKISGIARLERESGVDSFFLSLINLSASKGGEYCLLLFDRKKPCLFHLGQRPSSFSVTLNENRPITSFAVGLAFVKDGIPLLIGFGKEKDLDLSISDMKKCLSEYFLEEFKKKEKNDLPNFTPNPFSPSPSTTPLPLPKKKEDYDDEVVATENYYLFDDDLQNKINIINGMDNSYVRTENELHSSKINSISKKDGKSVTPNQNEEPFNPSENFNDQPYRDKVRKELDELLLKFPREDSLEKTVADSKWVRINFSSENYYVVGVIYEKGKEKYICYGVPARYNETPPEELKGLCAFVPKDLFNKKGDGYFMMYQDAISGKAIKPVNSKIE